MSTLNTALKTTFKTTLIASSFAALLLGGDYVLANNSVKSEAQDNMEHRHDASNHHSQRSHHGVSGSSHGSCHENKHGNSHGGMTNHSTVDPETIETQLQLTSEQSDLLKQVQSSQLAMADSMKVMHNSSHDKIRAEKTQNNHQARTAMMTSHQELVGKFEQSLTDEQRLQWQGMNEHQGRGCHAR